MGASCVAGLLVCQHEVKRQIDDIAPSPLVIAACLRLRSQRRAWALALGFVTCLLSFAPWIFAIPAHLLLSAVVLDLLSATHAAHLADIDGPDRWWLLLPQGALGVPGAAKEAAWSAMVHGAWKLALRWASISLADQGASRLRQLMVSSRLSFRPTLANGMRLQLHHWRSSRVLRELRSR